MVSGCKRGAQSSSRVILRRTLTGHSYLLLGAAHEEVLEERGPDAEQPVELALLREPLVDRHVEELWGFDQ